MNIQQTLIVMRMLIDPRLPLERGDIFTEAILEAPPGHPFALTEQRLDLLSAFLPDLVSEYRQAGALAGK